MGHLEIIAGFIISYLEDNPNSAFEPGDDWIWYVRGPHEEFQRHLKELSITSEYFNDVDISKINDISNNEYDTALANSTTNLMGENKNDDNEAHLAKFFCQQVLNTLPDRFRKALSSISNGLDSNEFDDYDLEKGEDEADSFDNRNETNIYEEEMDFFIHLNAQLDDKEAERLGFDSAYRLAGVTNSHVKDGNHTDEDSLSNAIVFDEHGDPVYLDSEGNPIPGIPIPITGNEAFFTMAVYDSFLSDGSDYSESGESSDPDSPDLTLTHE